MTLITSKLIIFMKTNSKKQSLGYGNNNENNKKWILDYFHGIMM